MFYSEISFFKILDVINANSAISKINFLKNKPVKAFLNNSSFIKIMQKVQIISSSECNSCKF